MSSTTVIASQDSPSWGEMFAEWAPWIAFVFAAGPPVLFLVGPLVIVVLGGLLWPFALVFALAAAVLVLVAAFGLAVALVTSPWLLVRHVRARLAVRANVTEASAHLVAVDSPRAIA